MTEKPSWARSSWWWNCSWRSLLCSCARIMSSNFLQVNSSYWYNDIKIPVIMASTGKYTQNLMDKVLHESVPILRHADRTLGISFWVALKTAAIETSRNIQMYQSWLPALLPHVHKLWWVTSKQKHKLTNKLQIIETHCWWNECWQRKWTDGRSREWLHTLHFEFWNILALSTIT